ncbi:MAG: Glycosyltransferase, group 1 family protein [Candidatus Woesebacteria bacterium GW2011_GWB1_39_10]|uniref:Glycosyltransferase, group 1 family protein n=4 Tax=Candidatus Woeseibacteriota TaxID=1752722 RepID=A0A0G0UU36_9BACT|nr:MAG: Glycosyltransferase, group 1 family protein [Candidatus Woesebacteria bacterium GW2011_GWB1_39_10]KKR92218.1 MAG: Glycosyltransferase, group 1 family protein [Candidatus Woesebacteria bacterium GW2011_GWA1_41_13b]
MKIAYFTDTYIPQVNGVTYVVDTHARFLAKKNKVRIYAPAYGLRSSIERLEKGNLIIERYPSGPVIYYKEVHIPFVDIGKMYRSVKKFNPDVIHFHTPLTIGISSMIIAKYLKIPLITTYHTLWSETLPPLPPFRVINSFFRNQIGQDDLLRDTIWKVSNKIFDYCDVIISPANIIKDELILHNSKSKIVVISNGVDTNKFVPKIRTKTNFRILYIGRLSAEKNVDVIIKAFKIIRKKINEATLEIVGDGPAAKTLKILVKKLGLTKMVVFCGYVPREKLVSYYNRCDIFATGSAMEVQPLTVLEAMSCGLPIVGINKAGVAGMIKNGVNGFLIPTPNSHKMADKIIEILVDDGLRAKMGKYNRKIALKNRPNLSIKKLERLYKDILHFGE